MHSTRFAWLAACLVFMGLAAGCSSGDAPVETETETESAAPPAEVPETPEAPDEEPDPESEGTDIPAGVNPVIEMNTNMGMIAIELYADEAPKSVENFLAYVRGGFYDGTIFHRVIPGFVIQGGGFTADMIKKETELPIENEADNGIRNLRGTICMARTNDPHSATSQFFINLKDNPPLDHRNRSIQGWGYAVFGKVIEGLDIVDQIAGVPTTSVDHYQDVPAEAVVVETAVVR